MARERTNVGAAVRVWRKRAGLSQKQLSAKAGINEGGVRDIESGKVRSPRSDTLTKLANALGCHPMTLYLGLSDDQRIHPDSSIVSPDSHQIADNFDANDDVDAHLKVVPTNADEGNRSVGGGSKIIEVDVRAGAGGGGEAAVAYDYDEDGNGYAVDQIKASWQFPPDYLRHELGVRPERARIVEVLGDSMEPTLRSGDRVVVDLDDVRPRDAIFALWDGFGVVVKRVEPVMDADTPTLRIRSDNPHHGAYTLAADEVRLIGRVCWRATRL